MPVTSNLKLPLIAPAQAQKHVTHNEALAALDALVFLAVASRRRTTPPASPVDGERHLIAAPASGIWLGHDGNLAVFLDGGWRYYIPQAGWIARILDESAVFSFDGRNWVDLVNAGGLSTLQNLSRLGVGTTADASNELAFKGNNLLVAARTTGEGGSGDVRAKINKQATSNIGSLLFQNNYVGRAEIGLIGDDDLVLKLSADGNTWVDALRASAAGGQLSIAAATADTHALNRLTADRRYLAVIAQALTSAQQSQARSNIGLGNAAMLNVGGANGLAQFNASGVLALPANALSVGPVTIGSGAGNNVAGTAIGSNSLQSNTTGIYNTAMGHVSLSSNTTGSNNTSVGYGSLQTNTTGSSNTAMGHASLYSNTTGSNNTSSGYISLYNNTIGNSNTAAGYGSLVSNTTGGNNTAIGLYSLSLLTNFSNASGIGYNAQVTGSNQIQLGESSTTTYVYGTVQNRSDERDKADIRPTYLGLEFINMLEPVDYRYDLREDYREPAPVAPLPLSLDASQVEQDEHAEAMLKYQAALALWRAHSPLANIKRDGSKKRKRYHTGFIAQSVSEAVTKIAFDERGWGAVQDHSMAGGEAVMSLGYDQFVPVLVKACQELSARLLALEKRLAALAPE